MKALKHHNLVRLNELRRVLVARVMVVDGLVHRLALLERLDLSTHQGKVILPCVKGCEPSFLSACPVVHVVIIKTDHGHHVPDGGMSGSDLRAEGSQDAAQEGGLATPGVSCHADDYRCLVKLLCRRQDWVHVICPCMGRIEGDAVHLTQLGLGLWRGPGQASGHAVCACSERDGLAAGLQMRAGCAWCHKGYPAQQGQADKGRTHGQEDRAGLGHLLWLPRHGPARMNKLTQT
mmetsp:Transcript_119008/g.348495  ORF Transcript_119008/g.348495 Transcript_119008/m.348495 type:complete len:234 (+) Transcript_119008:738-1439(+)